MQLYVVRSKVDKTGEEEKRSYYGVPIISRQVNEINLSAEICQRCSLTEADVLATISALSDLLQEHLESGESVKLRGIGTFSVSASSKGFDTPGECTPAEVKAQRVCFRADNDLRHVLEKLKYKRINKEVK